MTLRVPNPSDMTIGAVKQTEDTACVDNAGGVLVVIVASVCYLWPP
jgi:hypothetical protein